MFFFTSDIIENIYYIDLKITVIYYFIFVQIDVAVASYLCVKLKKGWLVIKVERLFI